MQIGCNIRYIRKTKGLTQKELAKLMGVNHRHLQDIETNKVDIKFSTLQKFSQFFKLTPAEIIESRYFILNRLSKRELNLFPEIVVETNTIKEMVSSNNAARDFYGDNHLGKFPHDYFFGKQNTYKIVEPVFSDIGGPVYVESVQTRIDGEPRLLAWWCKTVYENCGAVKGALSYATDITHYRTSEQTKQ